MPRGLHAKRGHPFGDKARNMRKRANMKFRMIPRTAVIIRRTLHRYEVVCTVPLGWHLGLKSIPGDQRGMAI